MCDRRIGEASNHIALETAVGFVMTSMPSENGRMKCVQTYLLALAALSGHLCDLDSIRIPFTPEKSGWRVWARQRGGRTLPISRVEERVYYVGW